MKYFLQKNFVLACALVGSVYTYAQQVATPLSISNVTPAVDPQAVMYASSVAEFAGYSAVGTGFNRRINVFRNGSLLFQATGAVNSFGASLAMNRDWLAVGAPRDGATIRDFNSVEETGSVFLSKSVNGVHQNKFSLKLTAQSPRQSDLYGSDIDIDGNWMVIAARGTGSRGFFEIWKQTSTGWERKQHIQPTPSANLSAGFANSVAIKGDYIVVGAPGENKVYTYKRTNDVWSLFATYSPELSTWGVPTFDTFGQVIYMARFGVDVDITFGAIIVGDPVAQKAAILAIQGNQLVRTQILHTPPDPELGNTTPSFGQSVAIQNNRAIVGAPFSGLVSQNPHVLQGRVYMYTDGYQYKGYMRVGNPANLLVKALGFSVAIDQDMVLAGAPFTDNQLTRPIEGTAFRMPFWFVFQSGRVGMPEASASLATGTLYPNPATGDQIELKNIQGTPYRVQAVMLHGATFQLPFQNNQVDIHTLRAGSYYIQVYTDKGVFANKLIKQ